MLGKLFLLLPFPFPSPHSFYIKQTDYYSLLFAKPCETKVEITLINFSPPPIINTK